jgi:hypothetical protein
MSLQYGGIACLGDGAADDDPPPMGQGEIDARDRPHDLSLASVDAVRSPSPKGPALKGTISADASPHEGRKPARSKPARSAKHRSRIVVSAEPRKAEKAARKEVELLRARAALVRAELASLEAQRCRAEEDGAPPSQMFIRQLSRFATHIGTGITKGASQAAQAAQAPITLASASADLLGGAVQTR